MAEGKAIPFALNRNDTRSLARQLADGLRSAIVEGYYKPGETLPQHRDLAPLLGVSEIVTKAAIKQLGKEGYVVARPRIGTVVRNRTERQWRGHVVLVQPEGDDVYILTVIAGILRTALTDAGWIFSQVRVQHDARGRHDFAHLDAVISHRADLVVALYPKDATRRHLALSRIPCAVFTDMPKPQKGVVGLTRLDANLAVNEFAGECARAGIRKVVKFYWDTKMCNISPALASLGIASEDRLVVPGMSRGRLDGVRRAGMALFLKMAAERAFEPDTLYLVADDYLAAGALMALGYAGLKTPEDVRIAVWATAGIANCYPRELSRMELDPVACGKTLTVDVLEYLKTGIYPQNSIVGPQWIVGETMQQEDHK